MAQILRLEIDYGAGHAQVVSSRIVEGEPPPGDPAPDEDAGGVWLSVSDGEGTGAFHRVLPQPDRPAELFSPDGTIQAAPEGRTGKTNVVVDVPWTGDDAALSVRSGVGGLAMDDSGRAAEIMTMSLGAARDVGPGSADLVMGDDDPPVTPLPFGQDHAKALRLVFLPDGFTQAELPRFHAVVDDFLKMLAETPPFEGMTSALSACRVEIASPTSGIKDPQAPGNGARPVFGSRLGAGDMRRLIEADQTTARKAARKAAGGHAHFAGIIVANTTEYGGSGGDVAVFSCDELAGHIAIHELGHSQFELADEYSDAGQSSTDKPIEDNVAAKPNPNAPAWAPGEGQQLKWGALLSAGVAFPTAAAGADPETVGAYEGAKYKPTGLFRPSSVCKMRVVTAPFCRVCRNKITARLQAHLP